jgi:flagellar biogenesis protein FliO
LVSFYLILVHCSAGLPQEEELVAQPTEEPTPAPSSEAPPGEQPVEQLETTSLETEQGQVPEHEPEREPELFPLRDVLEVPAETPEFDLLDSVRKMAVALLLVIALLCLAVLLFKRVTKGVPLFLDQRVGRVVGRIYLNPKAILYLVKIADRVLVIGANPTTISLIAEITDPEMVRAMERTHPEPGTARSSFASHFRQFHARFSGVQQAAEEEAKLEEHLRDIKDQMAKLQTLIGGGSGNEEQR